jgi:hypothetical protein
MTNLTNQQQATNIEKALEQLKQETAAEMGIELGADTSSRMNGVVGGRITQKLIALGKQQLENDSINHVSTTQYKTYTKINFTNMA